MHSAECILLVSDSKFMKVAVVVVVLQGSYGEGGKGQGQGHDYNQLFGRERVEY